MSLSEVKASEVVGLLVFWGLIGIVLLLLLVGVSLGLGSLIHWAVPSVERGDGALISLISVAITARAVWGMMSGMTSKDLAEAEDDEDELVITPREIKWLSDEMSRPRPRPKVRRPRRGQRDDQN